MGDVTIATVAQRAGGAAWPPAGDDDYAAFAFRRRTDETAGMSVRPTTCFLNVDLDVFAASPLETLADGFGRRALLLHAGRHGRHFRAHFELHASPRASADRLIAGFVRLVDGLPPRTRALWNSASRRDFNIGIQAGIDPHAFEVFLTPETLRLASSVNARIAVTVYAPVIAEPKRGPDVRRRAASDTRRATRRADRG
jgi:hypothetical protein